MPANLYEIPTYYIDKNIFLLFGIIGVDFLIIIVFISIFSLLIVLTQNVIISIILSVILVVSLIIAVHHKWFINNNYANKVEKETYEKEGFYEDKSLSLKPESRDELGSFIELSLAVSLGLVFYDSFLSSYFVTTDIYISMISLTLVTMFFTLSIAYTMYFTFIRRKGVLVEYKTTTVIKHVQSNYRTGIIISEEISGVTVEKEKLHIKVDEDTYFSLCGELDEEGKLVLDIDNPEEVKDHINKYRTLENL